jgi:hypothetical protein
MSQKIRIKIIKLNGRRIMEFRRKLGSEKKTIETRD